GLGGGRSPAPPGPPGAPPRAGPAARAPAPGPAESVYARPARGRAVALWRGGTRLPVALARLGRAQLARSVASGPSPTMHLWANCPPLNPRGEGESRGRSTAMQIVVSADRRRTAAGG